MMTGMDDRDDPECDLTLEAMAGLSKILAVVDENNVRHIFINICLRIRPCFVKVCLVINNPVPQRTIIGDSDLENVFTVPRIQN